MSRKPSIAIFGPSGNFIGSNVTPSFLEALDMQQISSLKLFTRDPESPQHERFRKGSAQIVKADFGDKSALTDALRGTDIVISCMGTSGDYKKNKETLIEACTA